MSPLGPFAHLDSHACHPYACIPAGGQQTDSGSLQGLQRLTEVVYLLVLSCLRSKPPLIQNSESATLPVSNFHKDRPD